MALYVREGSEAANIRGLVESCAAADDITALARLVFDAQALADTPPSIAADGQTMVDIICGALRAVAEDQAAAVQEICAANAPAIAGAVGELEHMFHRVDEVKASLLGANAGMQEAGGELAGSVQAAHQLTEVQDNLAAAAAAVAAAQGVLGQCLAAGELVAQRRLYPALCLLDRIRRKHLASLLSMLSSTKQQQQQQLPWADAAAPPASAASAGAAAPGGGKRPAVLSGRDAEHLQQLAAFFNGLVDDLSAAVQRLALRGFNSWLVGMRAAAREVGLAAIQAAAVERSLEDSLAAERRLLLAALARPAGRSVRDIARELGQAPFRQELLRSAADEAAAAQAANKAAAGSTGGSSSGGGSSSNAPASVGDKQQQQQRSLASAVGGGSFSREAGDSIRELLKRPSAAKHSKLPRQLAAATAAAAAEKQQREQQQQAEQEELQQQRGEQQQQHVLLTELPSDVEELHPGEPERAIAEIIRVKRDVIHKRQQQRAARQQAQQEQEQAAASGGSEAAGASRAGMRALQRVDMAGLFTALHVARSLGQMEAFRSHYLDQRRLQISADLQVPSHFLTSYQAYLAQITGFFTLEAYVQRLTEGLVGPQEAAQLWGVALRGLRAALGAAFEPQHLTSAPQMLMVKEFVVLMRVALEGAGHAGAPVTELLQSTVERYHDLLGASLAAQLDAVVEADVLAELEVRSPQQHARLVVDNGLPWKLEGATAPGRRAQQQLSPDGAPPLPYVAPFTACVPEVLALVRKAVTDSLAYLRDLYSPWELLPAVFQQRDRMLTKVLVEVLSTKARTVGSGELLRECMKCAANAWALSSALDALDDWTIAQARPDMAHSELAATGEAGARQQQQPSAGPGGGKQGGQQARARNRKAVLASGATTSAVQAALRAVQEASERDVLRGLTSRVDQLLAESWRSAAEWTPPEPLSSSPSAWVNALLSTLQEVFDLGVKLLPRSSITSLMRRALRSTGAAAVRGFGCGPSEGPKAFNLYALERLAANLATMERFAGRWGVASLQEELAAPKQLCDLLLTPGRLDAYLTAPSEARRAQFGALPPALVVVALERFKEVPHQGRSKPQWLTKKGAEAAAKQLKAQQAAAAAAAAAGAAE